MKKAARSIQSDKIFQIYARIFFTKAISDLVIGSFLIIFIFRTTQSIVATVFCMLLYLFGLFIGTIIAALLSKRANFLTTVQSSFFLTGVIFIAIATSISFAPQFIPFLIFLYGFPVGLYFISQHQFQTTLINTIEERQSLIFSVFGVSRIMATILPIVAGVAILYGGYELVFAAVGIIYMLAAAVPLQLKLKAPDTFSIKEFQQIMNNPYMPKYLLFVFVAAAMNEVRNLAFLLIPFFFLLKSEVNIGLLLSGIALSSGIVTWIFRNAQRHITTKYSILGGIFITIVNLGFGIIWTPLALIIRSILLPIGEIFYIPQSDADEYTAIHAVIGKSKSVGLELLLLREAAFFVARAFATIIFLAAYDATGQNYMIIAQVIMIMLAIWPLVTFLLRIRLIEHIESLIKRAEQIH